MARGDVVRDALGVDQALQEGVGGEAVRAVDAGAGDLSARVQAGNRRAAPEVRADASGGVVRGGRHGDGLGDRVDAVGAAGGEDRGEPGLPHLGAEVPGVQIHVLGAQLLHAARDALGDDVARRELGQLVLADHEADPVGVDEVGTLTAYGLGDQRLLALRVRAEEEHRRVELHELQVGDLRARAQGERDAVAGGDGRIGRGGEDLAHAAGREDHGGRERGADAVVLALPHDVQGDTRRAPVGVREEVEDQGVLDGPDATRAYRLDEGAGDLGAGGVAARVRDAAAVVAALPGEREGAVGRLVEVGAGRDEPAVRRRGPP